MLAAIARQPGAPSKADINAKLAKITKVLPDGIQQG